MTVVRLPVYSAAILALVIVSCSRPSTASLSTLPASPPKPGQLLWLAIGSGEEPGSTVAYSTPSGRLFLPFQANWLIAVDASGVQSVLHYRDFRWESVTRPPFSASWSDAGLQVSFDSGPLTAPHGLLWWTASGKNDPVDSPALIQGANGDSYLPHYYDADLNPRGRFGPRGFKPRIYQLLPRLFGNESETRQLNGTLKENGSGSFSDLSAPVLEGLAADGFTHLWLTGVLQQATSTDFSDWGQPPDDPDLLKGIAGSPYAIKDYFDVSPDYADDPGKRLDEFRALIKRIHSADLRVLIDFVPNHVARSYQSDIRPDLSFGTRDRTDHPFHPENNFFYLEGDGPLRLPTVDPESGEIISETARLAGGADGLYPPETGFGRVTGNNVVSWQPNRNSWYETVKLNYGYNFLDPDDDPHYPTALNPDIPLPDTWKKMDAVIAYWQDMGVDGFRADMAHMVPPEFWKWLIHRSRQRNPDVFWMAEAYDNDPAKVAGHDPALNRSDHVMLWLLDAGFHAVYDDPGYDTLEHLYTRGAWANDLERVQASLGPFFFDCAVRYAENHDEIRLAHPDTWGGNGMNVGRPVVAALFGLSRGPVMIYHGQMVGEPAKGAEGFGGDDQRTTIFDYWSMPAFNRWWNDGLADGGRLSRQENDLRSWYTRLLQLLEKSALADGNYLPLNLFNEPHEEFGRTDDASHSGQSFLAYLRHDPRTGQSILVTSNLNARKSTGPVQIRLPKEALEWILPETPEEGLLMAWDLLQPDRAAVPMPASRLSQDGIRLPGMEPLTAAYWKLELKKKTDRP